VSDLDGIDADFAAAGRRIAELEATNQRLLDVMRAAEPVHKRRWERLQKLETENKRLREALQSIAANSCCDKCQEAALVARKALQEGEG
jgi:hypothetical protein